MCNITSERIVLMSENKITNAKLILFGDRLACARKVANLTQVNLATLLGVSKGTIAMWETNKREPSFVNLKKISILLNCSIDWLLWDY